MRELKTAISPHHSSRMVMVVWNLKSVSRQSTYLANSIPGQMQDAINSIHCSANSSGASKLELCPHSLEIYLGTYQISSAKFLVSSRNDDVYIENLLCEAIYGPGIPLNSFA